MSRRERRAAGQKFQPSQKLLRGTTPATLHAEGLRLKQAGLLLEAQLCCQQALATDPAHAESMHLLGLLSHEAKQYDHAVEWFARAIRLEPKPEYLSGLGSALQQLGRHAEALKTFDKAVQLRPDDPDLWRNLGMALADTGRPDEAMLSFQHALKLDPEHWDAAYRIGFMHREQGRPGEALPYFDLVDRLRPNHRVVLEMRAIALHTLKRYEEALSDNRRAYALYPQNSDTCNNIGASLQFLCRDEEALPWFDRAVALRPDHTVALLNKASSLQQLHRFDEAVTTYNQVKAIDPGNAEPEWNMSLLQLLYGDFEAGWANREARWRKADPGIYPKFSQPRWFGERNVEGKTIVVCADEGLGDTIQFARYVPAVAALGARVFLVVDSPALSLLTGLQGVTQIFRKSGDILPPFDMHCPMSGLPLAFGTRLDTIPPGTDYLPPLPEERVQAWRDRLGIP